MVNRFCLPLAATPSSFSMSEPSNFPKASMKPLKFASIREGLTDLGRTTHPFLSAEAKRSKNTRYSQPSASGWEEDRTGKLTQPSEEYIGGFHVMLGSDFYCDLFIEKRCSSRSEGRVSCWDDSFGFEVFHEVMVGVIQVELKLTTTGGRREKPLIPTQVGEY